MRFEATESARAAVNALDRKSFGKLAGSGSTLTASFAWRSEDERKHKKSRSTGNTAESLMAVDDDVDGWDEKPKKVQEVVRMSELEKQMLDKAT